MTLLFAFECGSLCRCFGEGFACIFDFLFVSIPDIYPFLFGRYNRFLLYDGAFFR